MKKKKLSLDKLILGSLSAVEQANVLGGDDGSVIIVNTNCVPPTPTVTQKPTQLAPGGCPPPTGPSPKPTTFGVTCQVS